MPKSKGERLDEYYCMCAKDCSNTKFDAKRWRHVG